jgi:hypothetical protein
MTGSSLTSKFCSFFFGLGVVLIVALPTMAQEKLDLTTPEGALTANRKIQCSTEDNRPIYYYWNGKAFSRRMGEADQVLFHVDGMNVRMCATVEDDKRGTGYRLVSREILLYTDPKTGEPLVTWDNPWTGQTVNVLHVENDPVNGRSSFPYAEDGSPSSRWFGQEMMGKWWSTITVPLFYHNVLQGDYQKQVGGVYHATEMFNYSGDMENLISKETQTANVHVGWVRQSDWLPWMEMQGREGIIYFHTAGMKVAGYDSISDVMKKYIEEKAPIYRLPPPADDDRENETSWTYYKKKVEGEKLPRGGAN